MGSVIQLVRNVGVDRHRHLAAEHRSGGLVSELHLPLVLGVTLLPASLAQPRQVLGVILVLTVVELYFLLLDCLAIVLVFQKFTKFGALIAKILLVFEDLHCTQQHKWSKTALCPFVK